MPKTSLKVFLNEIIDYAGLFPPARLSMKDALHNYLEYRKSPHGWIISRFICPASRLMELDDELSSYSQEIFPLPLRLSVTCSSAPTTDELFSILESEFMAIKKFKERHDNNVKIELLEIKIPQSLLEPTSTGSQVKKFLDDLVDFIDDELTWQVCPFLEPQASEHWKKNLNTLFSGFALHYDEKALWTRDHSLPPGIKLRCGGAFLPQPPPASHVARILSHCSATGITFKATAGLHHPFPHHDNTQSVMEHGFINVFLAAILAFTRNISEETLQAIIKETEPKRFIFTDDAIGWNDHIVSTTDIKKARQQVLSFGSCDFLEPIEELQQHGLL